jgi:hypothetical protein
MNHDFNRRMRAVASVVFFGSIVAVTACSSSSTNASSGGGGGADAQALGPGAAFKCTSSGKDAWDTYGAAAFVAVNESIFTNVGTELTANGTSNLGTAFTLVGTGMPAATDDGTAAFKGNLAAFLVYAYGGPTSIMYTDGRTYDGPQDMTMAHTGLAITSSQYDYFVSDIIVPALTTNGVPTGDVTSCFAPVLTDATFKASIVGK